MTLIRVGSAPAVGTYAGHGVGHDRAGQSKAKPSELTHDATPLVIDLGGSAVSSARPMLKVPGPGSYRLRRATILRDHRRPRAGSVGDDRRPPARDPLAVVVVVQGPTLNCGDQGLRTLTDEVRLPVLQSRFQQRPPHQPQSVVLPLRGELPHLDGRHIVASVVQQSAKRRTVSKAVAVGGPARAPPAHVKRRAVLSPRKHGDRIGYRTRPWSQAARSHPRPLRLAYRVVRHGGPPPGSGPRPRGVRARRPAAPPTR